YHPIDPAAWTFIGRPGGKPVLTADLAEASGLSFNLTHTEGMVACAVTRGAEVGVDLEATDRRTDPLRLARRFFATQEAGELVSLPEADRQTRFVEVWTLKEAAVKALGTGLRLPLDDCVFLDDGPGRLRFVQAQGWSSGHWHFALLAPTDRHRLAVAMLSPGAEPPPRVLAWRQPLARAGEVPPATSAFPDALRVRG
ncbi:MAG: 4'-phosphopantetheinyl transferase superfamily protein, partial [Vicinamibacterales bacterium]|nr:4'-phosphopantetheinyl transferase superfamily protein [Vicinamibacterales bacterium]